MQPVVHGIDVNPSKTLLYAQFSTRRPATLPNSRSLFETRISFRMCHVDRHDQPNGNDSMVLRLLGGGDVGPMRYALAYAKRTSEAAQAGAKASEERGEAPDPPDIAT